MSLTPRSWLAVILFQIALGTDQTYGQTAPRGASPADGYIVDSWTTDDGLPQNSVNGIVQTSDGYLWLGTYGGLARFDGVRFTLVPRTDASGTHVDRIVTMSLSRGDTIWLGTEKGLLRYAGGAYRYWGQAEGFPGRSHDAILSLPEGGVLVTTPAGLFRFLNERFEKLDSLSGGLLRRDSEGLIWRGWANGTSIVYRIPRNGGVQRDPRWTDAQIFQFHDHDGARWLSAIHGGRVFRLVGPSADGNVRRWNVAHGIVRPNFITRDGGGELWLGNQGGGVQLFRPDAPGGGRAWPVAPGDVRLLFVDAEGTLWVGTNGLGLIRITRKLFNVVADADAKVITAVFQDRAGRMWLGSSCGGLYRADDGRTFARFRVAGMTLSCVTSIAEGADGAMWLGGYGTLFRIQDGRVSIPRDAAGKSLSNVVALHVARNGTVWAGRYNRGLNALRADGSLIRHFGPADGLRNDDVAFVTDDSTGTVWIGTNGGLGRLRDDRIDWFTVADGLPADNVRAVLPDADGTVWIGTYGGGLARFRDGRFQAIRASNGLSDDVVSSITADDRGNFWMSGNRGIFRVRRADLHAFADGRTARIHSILYGRGDGLLNVETNGGFQPAAWRTQDGRIWFPTLRGAAVIDPAHAGLDGPPPPAVIEAVVVNGTAREARSAFEIEPGNPNVEVHYTGLSFTAPANIVFRYRLVGYDEGWTEAGTRRIAYYPRLPPGRFRFEVAAANRDGVWGEASGLAVRARPAVWQTLWFRGMLLLTAMGAVAAAAQRRVTVARRAQAAQQAFSRALIDSQEAERRRIAGELHDGLGQDLLLVKNYAALALIGPDPGAGREHFEKIGELATGALRSVRTLAHNLTPRQLDHVGITQALSDVLRTAEEASTVRFNVALDDIDDAFNLDSKINIFRIVQEAVSNMLKYADAREAKVRLTRGATEMTLVIADDGRGFDLRAGRRGLGLDGMRQRIEMLGGTLAVESAPGAGTRITAMLPLPLPEAP